MARHTYVLWVRRWLVLAIAVTGWVLIGTEPVIKSNGIIVGPSELAWQTLAAASVITAFYSVIRPSPMTASVAGGITVAIGMWRGVLYWSLDASSPLGVWLLVTALTVEVTIQRLERM